MKCKSCKDGEIKCPRCNGKGIITYVIQSSHQCSHCNGSGVKKCGVCDGKGYH